MRIIDERIASLEGRRADRVRWMLEALVTRHEQPIRADRLQRLVEHDDIRADVRALRAIDGKLAALRERAR